MKTKVLLIFLLLVFMVSCASEVVYEGKVVKVTAVTRGGLGGGLDYLVEFEGEVFFEVNYLNKGGVKLNEYYRVVSDWAGLHLEIVKVDR